jgi:hypothetical protein
MTTKNLKNFERQAEILALTLGLENNNKFKSRGAGGRDHYQSLFSIYIKMIKDSEHNTFINNESKPQVIQSLQRTIDFYNTKKKEDIQNLFGTLEKNDPTSFIIVPVSYLTLTNQKKSRHTSSLIVYKMENEYIVTMIDKEKLFNSKNGGYVTISQDKLEDFSALLLDSKTTFDYVPTFDTNKAYGILKKIMALSNEKNLKILPIKLSKQTMGNCIVAGAETSLRMALSNCHQNIFETNKQIKLCSLFQMREYFLKALKGTNSEQNKYLDEIFSYYLKRKEQKEKVLPKLTPEWNSWKNPVHKIMYIAQKRKYIKKKEEISLQIAKEFNAFFSAKTPPTKSSSKWSLDEIKLNAKTNEAINLYSVRSGPSPSKSREELS